MVAAAGPLSNLLLAILAVLISLALPVNSFISNALVIFIQLNVALFVFNLVPIPPLDGSRVVYAFAPDIVRNFFDTIEPFGFFIIIALLYLNGLNVIFSIDQMVLNVLSRL
jgi:Zn-dependent protease